jgi:hypothetical protein
VSLVFCFILVLTHPPSSYPPSLSHLSYFRLDISQSSFSTPSAPLLLSPHHVRYVCKCL